MKLIIGISGKTYEDESDEYTFGTAGSGKDTVADFIVAKHRAVKVSLADPLKRICREVFDFSDEQLWGPSEKRNEPDPRWLHLRKGGLGSTRGDWNEGLQRYEWVDSPKTDEFLTPRHALQQLGTQWGRACSKDVWVRYALKTANRLFTGDVVYDQKMGTIPSYELASQGGHLVLDGALHRPDVVVIPDVRFENEVHAIVEAGGKVIRVKRKVEALKGSAGAHVSEKGVSLWEDAAFNYTIENNSTLENLAMNVARMMDFFSGRILPYSEEQKDVPPFMRGR